MRLGIISDTHDNVPMVTRAVDYFNHAGVDMVLHAGDYVAPFAVKPLLSLECDFLGVWGNNDGDKIALQKMAGGKIENTPFVTQINGHKILLGHYFETLSALVVSQTFYLIVYGHTHKPEISKQGKTLVVNPGECGGWLEGKSTVAVVDMAAQTAEIIELKT